MIKVTVRQGHNVKTLDGEKGLTVMELLRAADIFIDTPCGGRGHCGKCMVKVSGSISQPEKAEKDLLSPTAFSQGYRLACFALANGDIEVTVPVARTVEVETDSLIKSCTFEPSVTCFSSDRFEVDFCGETIVANDTATPVIGMAVDIGTTTLAARFFDLVTGKNLGAETLLNPQRRYGADVISRIEACADDSDTLCKAVRGALTQMADDFCIRFGAASQNIYHCVIAGNTVMQHIAAGLSPQGMACSPFEPASLFGCETKDKGALLGINPGAHIYFSPCVSAFVGGDITAGLLACDFDRLKKPALFVDIGTNGEMALLCDKGILCCSAAAGPAFEGAHIACGTGSVAGAVNKVTLDGSDIIYNTIGGEKAVGICGSGLIDATAALLDTGLIDETGMLDSGFENADRGTYYPIGESGVYITQQDLREVQLAKSAIASGIETLLDCAGLKAADLSQVFVAGGFGTRMNMKSACRIGLLPREFLPLAEPVGNTSLAGASILLLDRYSFDRIDKIKQRCRLTELAGNAFFQRRFIENMLFDS